jgi:hypothetical protein
MRITRTIWYTGTVLATLAMLAASATAAGQAQSHASRGRAAHGADSNKVERQRAASVKGFRGLASKLNTTPEALASAFDHARATNPRLSRGNFVAANVLADNLGAQHPGITTAAILSGLQSGKSIGETLQSLGLSTADNTQAREAADSDTKDFNGRIKDADHRDQVEREDAQERSTHAAKGKNKNKNKNKGEQ